MWVAKKAHACRIIIHLVGLRSCEVPQELALAGIEVDGSEENAQNSIEKMSKFGLRSARKLTFAGIKISLVELRSCELRQKLAVPECK